MMKNICYIFLCALLLLGISETTHKDLQGFRSHSGIPASHTSLDSESCDCAFTVANEGAVMDFYHLFNNEDTGYKVNDAILGTNSISSGITPSKVLKYNPHLNVVQTLSLLNSQVHNSQWHSLSDTQSIKYSHRYYLYTLSHILI